MSSIGTWMPLYVSDYIMDTAHLTMEQSGCYMQLLMHYWRSGPLPNDMAQLGAVCRMSRTYFARKVWPVLSPFFTEANGRIFQKRIEREREKAAKISAKRAEISHKRWTENRDKTDVFYPIEPNDDSGLNLASALPIASETPKQLDVQSPSSLREDTKNLEELVSKCVHSPDKPGKAHASAKVVTFPTQTEPAQAVALWNELAGEFKLSRIAKITEVRRRQVLARIRDCATLKDSDGNSWPAGIEGWKKALDEVRVSPFLLGHSKGGFTASFDFMLQASSFVKLVEGQYRDRSKPVAGNCRDTGWALRRAAERRAHAQSGAKATQYDIEGIVSHG